ncbi:MAG: BlaI/MecI/CopY family transcriptional regulator [Terriglobia bacterium]
MAKAIARKIEEESAGEPQSPRPCQGPQELSRLELECMRAIWLGHASTVHAVQEFLSPFRPLAYTTVMTILDRLAQKGAVTRAKNGKAYQYAPALGFEASREAAVRQLIDFYFDGSSQKLTSYLTPPAPAGLTSPEPHDRADEAPVENPAEIQDCLL